jgi:hypothetical protein
MAYVLVVSADDGLRVGLRLIPVRATLGLRCAAGRSAAVTGRWPNARSPALAVRHPGLVGLPAPQRVRSCVSRGCLRGRRDGGHVAGNPVEGVRRRAPAARPAQRASGARAPATAAAGGADERSGASTCPVVRRGPHHSSARGRAGPPPSPTGGPTRLTPQLPSAVRHGLLNGLPREARRPVGNRPAAAVVIL